MHLLKIHGKDGWGLIFWTMSFYNSKKFISRSFQWGVENFFEFTVTCFLSWSKMNIFGFRLWLVWVEARDQKKQSSEFKSFYMHRKKISLKKITKMLGISKAIRVFVSPPTMYLAIWVYCLCIQRSLSNYTLTATQTLSWFTSLNRYLGSKTIYMMRIDYF